MSGISQQFMTLWWSNLTQSHCQKQILCVVWSECYSIQWYLRQRSVFSFVDGLHRALTSIPNVLDGVKWNANFEPEFNTRVWPHRCSGGWMGAKPCSRVQHLVESLKRGRQNGSCYNSRFMSLFWIDMFSNNTWLKSSGVHIFSHMMFKKCSDIQWRAFPIPLLTARLL